MPELNDKRSQAARAPEPLKAEVILQSDRFKKVLGQVIARHLSSERFGAVAIRQFSKIPELKECNPYSVAACVLEAAALGLEIGLNGECWMVPFRDKERGLEAQLQIGYLGHLALLWRSGKVAGIHADVVCLGDEFSLQAGTDGYLHHKPAHDRDVTPANILWAYAVIRTTYGGWVWRAIDKREIDRLRGTGYSANSPAWTNWYDQMAIAKALKRAAKFAPRSREVGRAVTIDDEIDADVRQTFEHGDAEDLRKELSAGGMNPFEEQLRAAPRQASEEALATPEETPPQTDADAPNKATTTGRLGW